jgi:hypothetical protein
MIGGISIDTLMVFAQALISFRFTLLSYNIHPCAPNDVFMFTRRFWFRRVRIPTVVPVMNWIPYIIASNIAIGIPGVIDIGASIA